MTAVPREGELAPLTKKKGKYRPNTPPLSVQKKSCNFAGAFQIVAFAHSVGMNRPVEADAHLMFLRHPVEMHPYGMPKKGGIFAFYRAIIPTGLLRRQFEMHPLGHDLWKCILQHSIYPSAQRPLPRSSLLNSTPTFTSFLPLAA
jgi:hypothetical protein